MSEPRVIKRYANRKLYDTRSSQYVTLEQIAETSKKEDIPDGNPYRGLLPFEAEHRSLFFGRKSEIGTLIDRLRTEAFIVVAADSGVGKSSVCRAGVLPLIAEGALGGTRTWKEVTMIPGRRPLQALCIAISRELGIDEQTLQADLRQDPSNLPRTLYKTLGDKRGLVPELLASAGPLSEVLRARIVPVTTPELSAQLA